jgi:hypothetical protein
MIDLTETATFDTPITVPEGTDTHDLAAENVEDIAQRLANRTQWLKDRAENAAQLDEPNEFTGVPQIVDGTNNEIACWESPRTSLDDPAVPGNNWKLETNFKCDALRWYRVYTGGNAAGAVVHTVNAHWHKSDSKWRPDTTGQDSFAWFVIGEKLVISRMGAGPGSWAAWPTDKGDLVLGGDVLYAASKSRTSIVSLNEGVVFGGVGAAQALYRETFAGTATCVSWVSGQSVAWRLLVPSGSVIQNLQIIHNQSTVDSNQFNLIRRHGAVYDLFGATALPSFTPLIASPVNGPASAGLWTALLTPTAPITVDNSVNEYWVTWKSTGLHAADSIGEISVVWDDKGLRNG